MVSGSTPQGLLAPGAFGPAWCHLPHRPADDEIGRSLSAPLTPQPRRPINDGHTGAVVSDLLGDIGFCPVAAALAPHDQSNLRRERPAQGQRYDIAIASVASHTEIMPKLTDDHMIIPANLLSDRRPSPTRRPSRASRGPGEEAAALITVQTSGRFNETVGDEGMHWECNLYVC